MCVKLTMQFELSLFQCKNLYIKNTNQRKLKCYITFSIHCLLQCCIQWHNSSQRVLVICFLNQDSHYHCCFPGCFLCRQVLWKCSNSWRTITEYLSLPTISTPEFPSQDMILKKLQVATICKSEAGNASRSLFIVQYHLILELCVIFSIQAPITCFVHLYIPT